MEAQLAITRLNNILERALEHDVRHFIGIVLPRVVGRLLRHLDCLDTSSCCQCISDYLSLDAPVKCAEEKGCCVNGLADCQVAVVAENDSLVAAESLGDGSAFIFLESNASKVEADRVVIMKAARLVSVHTVEVKGQAELTGMRLV